MLRIKQERVCIIQSYVGNVVHTGLGVSANLCAGSVSRDRLSGR